MATSEEGDTGIRVCSKMKRHGNGRLQHGAMTTFTRLDRFSENGQGSFQLFDVQNLVSGSKLKSVSSFY